MAPLCDKKLCFEEQYTTKKDEFVHGVPKVAYSVSMR